MSQIVNDKNPFPVLININCKHVPKSQAMMCDVLFADFIPSVIAKSPKKEDNNWVDGYIDIFPFLINFQVISIIILGGGGEF